MSLIPEMPKLMPFYSSKMIKNLYQPFYDIINAQSMWVDACSNWFTQSNKQAIDSINKRMKDQIT